MGRRIVMVQHSVKWRTSPLKRGIKSWKISLKSSIFIKPTIPPTWHANGDHISLSGNVTANHAFLSEVVTVDHDFLTGIGTSERCPYVPSKLEPGCDGKLRRLENENELWHWNYKDIYITYSKELNSCEWRIEDIEETNPN